MTLVVEYQYMVLEIRFIFPKSIQVERTFLYFLKWRNADWLVYVLNRGVFEDRRDITTLATLVLKSLVDKPKSQHSSISKETSPLGINYSTFVYQH